MDYSIKYKNHTRDEIQTALNKASSLIDQGQTDSSKRDYLFAHPGNRYFRIDNGLDILDAYEIAKTITVDDFCHTELDSRSPNHERMYCFKFKYINSDKSKDVLYKFKFRTDLNGEDVFIMSLHYPDPNLQPWTHLW